ncbi:MAG TPA: PAS domain S-box protein [Flavisolibacter sp.]|nr:PAS domain S-box protein [Flavisolibacter sp.]
MDVLAALPGNRVVVLPDAPLYTVAAFSHDLLSATGLVQEDIIGKSFLELLCLSDSAPAYSERKAVATSFALASEQGHTQHTAGFSLTFCKQKGQPSFLFTSISVLPVYSTPGHLLYLAVTVVPTNQTYEKASTSGVADNHLQHEELNFLMNLMPQLVWHTLPDGRADFFNQTFLDYSGLTMDALRGDGWTKLLHPDDIAATNTVWKQALQSGAYYEVEHRLRGNDGRYRWFLTRGKALKDEEGNVLKWYGTTTDIQQRKEQEELLEKKVQERTEELEREKAFADSVLDASINGLMVLDTVTDKEGKVVDFIITKINKRLTDIIGMDASVVGKSYLSLFTSSSHNGIFDMYKKVFEEGRPLRTEIYSTNFNLNSWFEISAAKKGDKGIIATMVNITLQREAAKHLEAQKSLLDSILKYSPAGITVYRAIRDDKGQVQDFQAILANDAAERFTGIPARERFGKTVLELTPALRDSQLYRMAVEVIEKATTFQTEYHNHTIDRWLELTVVKMDAEHLINVFRDITSIKQSQLELAHSAERFRAVFEAAQSGMFTFAPVRDDLGAIIDFRFVVTNPSFAAYVGQTPAVLNGALGSTWFPGYLTNGVFDMYKQTYLTGETLRTDIHYNVDQHDIYLDLQSTKVGDEVLVTFNDYTPLKRMQQQLERTIEDLKHSNVNLEEFAYAASHDLKEPIRKIHVFSDLLKNELKGQLSQSQVQLFERLERAARRMGGLVDDLLAYSQVTKGAVVMEDIDLNEKVKQVMEDLELEIKERKARIHVTKLPAIKGNKRQFQQLFQNLLTNAIKYAKPGTPPEVEISCMQVNGRDVNYQLHVADRNKTFYHITVKDKGVGFDQKDAESIFQVFTRLHSIPEFRGTGVGLSIAKKVVENHQGYIWAESTPGEGATFNVLLPTD